MNHLLAICVLGLVAAPASALVQGGVFVEVDKSEEDWPALALMFYFDLENQPTELWINWTHESLRGDVSEESYFLLGAAGGYRSVGDEWEYNPGLENHYMSGRLRAVLPDLPYGWLRNVTIESRSENAQLPEAEYNPFHVTLGPVFMPEMAPRLMGPTSSNPALDIENAWADFTGGVVTITMQIRELRLGDCTDQRYHAALYKPLGDDFIWAHLLVQDSDLRILNMIVPSTEEGFVMASDLSLGDADITRSMRIQEGTPGFIQWELAGGHWSDGLAGPQQLQVHAYCDGVTTHLQEADLPVIPYVSWPLIFALLVFVAAIAMLVRK